MTWIESHAALAHHPKTLRLARALDTSVPAAIGHLHLLWWWAIEYAQDGDLSRFSPDEIAIAASAGCPADIFWMSLQRAGFVDSDGVLHDWNEYAGKLVERRKEDAERKKRARAASVRNVPSYSNEDVRRTSVGHPMDVSRTLPYPTVPNPTESLTANAVSIVPAKNSATNTATRAAPKPNKYAEFIDRVRAAGVEYEPSGPDAKAVNGSALRPDQAAEVYAALALREWGGEWQADNLTAANAIKYWNAYLNGKRNAGRRPQQQAGRRGSALDPIYDELRAIEAAKEPSDERERHTQSSRTIRDVALVAVSGGPPNISAWVGSIGGELSDARRLPH